MLLFSPRKITAGITLFCFVISQALGQDIAHAFSLSNGSEIPLASTFRPELPKELGTFETLHAGKNQNPVIFHIQEPHGNYEAQKKIEGILHYLKNHYGVNTLLLEGSAVKLHPELLQFDADDPKTNFEIAEALAKKSWLTGPELFLMREKNASAIGIEDLETYNRNSKALVDVLRAKDQTRTFLQEREQELRAASGKYLNSDLRKFLDLQEKFENHLILTHVWVDQLASQAKERLKIDFKDPAFQIDWPMLVRVNVLSEMEKKFEEGEFEKQREKFLIRVKEELSGVKGVEKGKPVLTLLNPFNTLLTQTFSSPAPANLESQIESLVASLPRDFDFKAYPQVNRFIGHKLLSAELKGDKLIREIELLTEKITNKLIKTEKEKEIVEQIKDYKLLKKLFSLELTANEYERIAYSVERIGEKRLNAISYPLNAALNFYRLAKERDLIMIKNIEKQLGVRGLGLGVRKTNPHNNAVVVITGGFHSKPFQEYFISKNYNYALITPKLSEVPKSENAYERILETATLRNVDGFALTSDELLDHHRDPQLWDDAKQTAKSELRIKQAAVLGHRHGLYGTREIDLMFSPSRAGYRTHSERLRFGFLSMPLSEPILFDKAQRDHMLKTTTTESRQAQQMLIWRHNVYLTPEQWGVVLGNKKPYPAKRILDWEEQREKIPDDVYARAKKRATILTAARLKLIRMILMMDLDEFGMRVNASKPDIEAYENGTKTIPLDLMMIVHGVYRNEASKILNHWQAILGETPQGFRKIIPSFIDISEQLFAKWQSNREVIPLEVMSALYWRVKVLSQARLHQLLEQAHLAPTQFFQSSRIAEQTEHLPKRITEERFKAMFNGREIVDLFVIHEALKQCQEYFVILQDLETIFPAFKKKELKPLIEFYGALEPKEKDVFAFSIQYWRETKAWPRDKEIIAFLMAEGYPLSKFYKRSMEWLKRNFGISRNIAPVTHHRTWGDPGIDRRPKPVSSNQRDQSYPYYVPSRKGVRDIHYVLDHLEEIKRKRPNTEMSAAKVAPLTEQEIDQRLSKPFEAPIGARRHFDEYYVQLPAVIEVGNRTLSAYAQPLIQILDRSEFIPLLEETLLAMARLGDLSYASKIRESLTYRKNFNHYRVRVAAIRALEILNDKSAVPEIAKRLNDSNTTVRLRALQAIDFFGASKEYIETIHHLTKDPDYSIRYRANAILASLDSNPRSELRKKPITFASAYTFKNHRGYRIETEEILPKWMRVRLYYPATRTSSAGVYENIFRRTSNIENEKGRRVSFDAYLHSAAQQLKRLDSQPKSPKFFLLSILTSSASLVWRWREKKKQFRKEFMKVISDLEPYTALLQYPGPDGIFLGEEASSASDGIKICLRALHKKYALRTQDEEVIIPFAIRMEFLKQQLGGEQLKKALESVQSEESVWSELFSTNKIFATMSREKANQLVNPEIEALLRQLNKGDLLQGLPDRSEVRKVPHNLSAVQFLERMKKAIQMTQAWFEEKYSRDLAELSAWDQVFAAMENILREVKALPEAQQNHLNEEIRQSSYTASLWRALLHTELESALRRSGSDDGIALKNRFYQNYKIEVIRQIELIYHFEEYIGRIQQIIFAQSHQQFEKLQDLFPSARKPFEQLYEAMIASPHQANFRTPNSKAARQTTLALSESFEGDSLTTPDFELIKAFLGSKLYPLDDSDWVIFLNIDHPRTKIKEIELSKKDAQSFKAENINTMIQNIEKMLRFAWGSGNNSLKPTFSIQASRNTPGRLLYKITVFSHEKNLRSEVRGQTFPRLGSYAEYHSPMMDGRPGDQYPFHLNEDSSERLDGPQPVIPAFDMKAIMAAIRARRAEAEAKQAMQQEAKFKAEKANLLRALEAAFSFNRLNLNFDNSQALQEKLHELYLSWSALDSIAAEHPKEKQRLGFFSEEWVILGRFFSELPDQSIIPAVLSHLIKEPPESNFVFYADEEASKLLPLFPAEQIFPTLKKWIDRLKTNRGKIVDTQDIPKLRRDILLIRRAIPASSLHEREKQIFSSVAKVFYTELKATDRSQGLRIRFTPMILEKGVIEDQETADLLGQDPEKGLGITILVHFGDPQQPENMLTIHVSGISPDDLKEGLRGIVEYLQKKEHDPKAVFMGSETDQALRSAYSILRAGHTQAENRVHEIMPGIKMQISSKNFLNDFLEDLTRLAPTRHFTLLNQREFAQILRTQGIKNMKPPPPINFNEIHHIFFPYANAKIVEEVVDILVAERQAAVRSEVRSKNLGISYPRRGSHAEYRDPQVDGDLDSHYFFNPNGYYELPDGPLPFIPRTDMKAINALIQKSRMAAEAGKRAQIRDLMGELKVSKLPPAVESNVPSREQMQQQIADLYQAWNVKVQAAEPKESKRKKQFQDEMRFLLDFFASITDAALISRTMDHLIQKVPESNLVFYADEFIASTLPSIPADQIFPTLKKWIDKMREKHDGKIGSKDFPFFRREIFLMKKTSESLSSNTSGLTEDQVYVYQHVINGLYQQLNQGSLAPTITVDFGAIINSMEVSEERAVILSRNPERGLGIMVFLDFGNGEVSRYMIPAVSREGFQVGINIILNTLKKMGKNPDQVFFGDYKEYSTAYHVVISEREIYMRLRKEGPIKFGIGLTNPANDLWKDLTNLVVPNSYRKTGRGHVVVNPKDDPDFFRTRSIVFSDRLSVIFDKATTIHFLHADRKVIIGAQQIWEKSEGEKRSELRTLIPVYREQILPYSFHEKHSREELISMLEKFLERSLEFLRVQETETHQVVGNAAVTIVEKQLEQTVSDQGKVILDESFIQLLAKDSPESLGAFIEALDRVRNKQTIQSPLLAIQTNQKDQITKLLLNRKVGISPELIAQNIEFVAPSDLAAFAKQNEFGVAFLGTGPSELGPVPSVPAYFNLQLDELKYMSHEQIGQLVFLIPALLSAAKLVRGEKLREKQLEILRVNLEKIMPGAIWKNSSIEIQFVKFLTSIAASERATAHSA